MKMLNILKKLPVILILVIVALLSIVKITPVATDVETHTHTVQQIDKEIDSVLKLTACATGASAAISLLPDDQCTPIAAQLAEFAKYFLVVLSALYLEKYLVTITGYASFSFLIPLACLLLIAGLSANREKVRILSYKLMICAVALYCIIPLSVRTSETVYYNYESTIEQTIDTADRISVANEDESGIERLVSWIENAAGTIVDYVTGLLSRFIEAIAVMLVTSCLIPILVVVCFFWLMKLLFKVDISMSDMEGEIKKLRRLGKQKEC